MIAQADLTTEPPAAAVLPPRPNLGPEPLPEPAIPPGLALAIGALGLLTVLTALALAHRRRRRRTAPSPSPAAEPPTDEPATPRDRLLRAAVSIRRSLLLRFGEPWAAKTTEEVADEPALAEWLGAERAVEVVRLLAEADLAKFAGPDHAPADDHSDDWEALVASLQLAEAGATSIKMGR